MLFAEAARHVGHADPDDVSAHLRKGTKAFLAGDHASARLVFEALIPSIAHGDIDVGQHEMVEDVLNVDVRATVAQYVTSVYTTTPLGERAGSRQYHRRRPTSPLHTRNRDLLLSNEAGSIVLRHAQDAC